MTDHRPRRARCAPCFPEPQVPDETIREDESTDEYLARSTADFALDLRRFTNANLQSLPHDVADAMCAALHGERFRGSFFEFIVARTVQILGAQGLRYEAATKSGRRPDLHALFADGAVVIDAATPEFDADLVNDQTRVQPLIRIIEEVIPRGWSFFVEDLPSIGLNDSRRRFKEILVAEFAKLGTPDASVRPMSVAVAAEHPQGRIGLLLGWRRPHWQRAYTGGPVSTAWGDTDSRVAKVLHRKRSQLRDSDAPAIIAVAGGMSEALEDFDIALFGRTFERQDEHRRVVEVGFDPSGIWGRLQGGESVIAAMLVYCHWQWTSGDDPVLYVNPRSTSVLPHGLELLHRRELRDGALTSTPAVVTGLFPLLRASAGLGAAWKG